MDVIWRSKSPDRGKTTLVGSISLLWNPNARKVKRTVSECTVLFMAMNSKEN